MIQTIEKNDSLEINFHLTGTQQKKIKKDLNLTGTSDQIKLELIKQELEKHKDQILDKGTLEALQKQPGLVAVIQFLMNHLGYASNLKITGQYDVNTKNAILKFQQECKKTQADFKIEGLSGKQTIYKLLEIISKEKSKSDNSEKKEPKKNNSEDSEKIKKQEPKKKEKEKKQKKSEIHDKKGGKQLENIGVNNNKDSFNSNVSDSGNSNVNIYLQDQDKIISESGKLQKDGINIYKEGLNESKDAYRPFLDSELNAKIETYKQALEISFQNIDFEGDDQEKSKLRSTLFASTILNLEKAAREERKINFELSPDDIETIIEKITKLVKIKEQTGELIDNIVTDQEIAELSRPVKGIINKIIINRSKTMREMKHNKDSGIAL